jgi:hypothetical protein
MTISNKSLCAAPLWGNSAVFAPRPFGAFAVKKVKDLVQPPKSQFLKLAFNN